MNKVSGLGTLIVAGSMLLTPVLEARTCSGNVDVIGAYGWIGSRTAAFPPASTTTINGSGTQIGALTAGAANSAPFASVGRVYLDGNGFIFSSSTPLTPVLQVGTYTVNLDCTVSATLTDTFATPGQAGLTPVQASATFEGVVVQNANEINLVQTGTGASGAVVTLRKAKLFNGCANDSLVGTFGMAASGLATASAIPGGTPVSTPFNLFGRFNSDGAGFLVQDSVGLTSPLLQRQFTGTYIVNLDCTGSATLVGSDTKTRKIDFVLVSPGGPSANSSNQTLAFTFADAGVVGTGLAQQQ